MTGQQTPSATARAVAARRLTFERLPAPFGDPDADERLAQDLIDSAKPTSNEPMTRYLEARTRFFDRVVINALERDVTQLVSVGAGYDGRSLRYAKPGVQWFEVDRPPTQDDKRGRLQRLKIDASHVRFVAHDLGDGGLHAALIANGFEPDTVSLTLCEGLAVYLDRPVLEQLLAELRALVTVGTRLAISLRPVSVDAEQHERFQQAVAALGEPARNTVTADDAADMFARARWRPMDIAERAQRAGFFVAAPEPEPAIGAAPPTASRIGRYVERLFHRRGIDGLPGHLNDTYGIEPGAIRRLDVGVFKLERRDGPAWVARVFASDRPLAVVQRDAELLQFLQRIGFPAERCADPNPVTVYQEQAVLVTEHVPGGRAKPTQAMYALLGDLLGRLNTLADPPQAAARAGGAWHHLVPQGDPAAELSAIQSLLDDAAPRVPGAQRDLYETLRGAVADAEDCARLPQALIHPDFAPANAIASAPGEATLVDWTGAGRGPRLWSLAFLLWAAGRDLAGVDSVMSGYSRHVELEAAELDRLPGAIAARPLVLACWSFAVGRERLAETVEQASAIHARAEAIAARARAGVWRKPRSRASRSG